MRTEYEIENDGSKAGEDCKTEEEKLTPSRQRATKLFPLEISYVICVMTTTTLHQHMFLGSSAFTFSPLLCCSKYIMWVKLAVNGMDCMYPCHR